VVKSGWITTGPRTKLLERRLAAYIETGKTDVDCTTDENIKKYSNHVVCLNSATAAEELNFRICGIGEGDEVIVPAYTYTASASAAIHCGAKVIFVDSQKDSAEMDYEKVAKAVDVPLVLHGASGIGDEDIKKAISLGIAKINIHTELCQAAMEAVNAHKDEPFLAMQREVRKAIKERAMYKIRLFGDEGRADE
jgi:hypothetical protein